MEIPFITCGATFFFATLFGIVLGFAAFMRYLSYKETLALAERGLLRPENGNGKGMLIWGILITALGMALCLGLYPIGWSGRGNSFPLYFGPWMIIALVPMFFGLGLLLIYVLTRKPAAATPEKSLPPLAAEQPQPAAEQPQPAAEQPQPAAEQPQPAAEQPQPGTLTPDP